MTAVPFPARLSRAATFGSGMAAALVVGFGNVIGLTRRHSPILVNLAAAAMVCYGVALIYLPAGVILGGLFLLARGRQMELARPSRADVGRGG